MFGNLKDIFPEQSLNPQPYSALGDGIVVDCLGASCNTGALIIRKGLGGKSWYHYNKETNGITNYLLWLIC